MPARPTLSLEQMQQLVRDADKRMQPMYEFWRFLEGLFRTGRQRPVAAGDLQPYVPIVSPQLLEAVNMVLGHIEIMVANSVARDPSLIVEAIGTGMATMSTADDGTLLGADDLELNAKFAQAVLAYFWKRGRMTGPLHDATEDMVKLGNGFLTAGWAFVATKARHDGHAEVLDAIDAAAADAADAGEHDVVPDLDELRSYFPLTTELVAIDEPFSEYVSPYDILVPATARRMETTPWVARRIVMSIDDARACEDFTNIDTLTTNASVLSGASLDQADRTGSDTSTVFQYATLYQFWNMAERKLVIFQVDAPKPLFDGPLPYLLRRPPFVHLRNHNDGGNTFWAFGDMENLAGPQLMFNNVVAARFKDFLRAGNKYFMHKKLMTPEVRRALESPASDVIIPLDLPANMELGQALQPVHRLATPSDGMAMEASLQDYMRSVPGLSDFQVGENGASRMAATAVAAVEGSTTLRNQDKVQEVEKAASDLGDILLALCQQFLDADRAVRIAGPGGAAWLNVRPSDIYGEFSVRTEGGSTRAVNPATLAQRGQTIANIVIPTLATVAQNPALWPATRQMLRDLGLDADHLMRGFTEAPAAAPEGAPAGEVEPAPEPEPSPEELGMSPGLDPASLQALQLLNAQSDALSGENVHPADALGVYGGPPVPAATRGDIAL